MRILFLVLYLSLTVRGAQWGSDTAQKIESPCIVPYKGTFALFGLDQSNFAFSWGQLIYDPLSSSWGPLKTGPQGFGILRGETCWIIDDNVFLFGGAIGVTTLNPGLQVVNLKNLTWSFLSLPTGGPQLRVDPMSTQIGRKVYMYGGSDSADEDHRNNLNDLWEFDGDTFQWTQLLPTGPVPIGRWSSAITSNGNFLYLYGGAYATPTQKAIDLYDFWSIDVSVPPASLKWNLLSNQTWSGDGAGGQFVSRNNSLYMFGSWTYNSSGVNTPHNGEIYSWDTTAATPNWTVVAYMPKPRYENSQSLIVDDLIYTFGQNVDPGASDGGLVQIFDLSSKNITLPTIYRASDPAYYFSKTGINLTLPSARYGHQAIKWNNKMCVYGGCIGENYPNAYTNWPISRGVPTDQLAILDLDTYLWSFPIPTGDVPNPRVFFTAHLFGDDQMLIFGGLTKVGNGPDIQGVISLNDIVILNLTTLVWKNQTQVQTGIISPRWSHASTIYEGKLYVFGGTSSEIYGPYDRYNDIWVCDLSTWKWTNLSLSASGSAPDGRGNLTIVAYRDKIYTVGGANNGADGLYPSDIYSFDLNTFIWTLESPFQLSVLWGAASGVALMGSYITIVGGSMFDGGYTISLKVFDLESKSLLVSDLPCGGYIPNPWAYMTAVARGSRMFVFGGYQRGDGQVEGVLNQVGVIRTGVYSINVDETNGDDYLCQVRDEFPCVTMSTASQRYLIKNNAAAVDPTARPQFTITSPSLTGQVALQEAIVVRAAEGKTVVWDCLQDSCFKIQTTLTTLGGAVLLEGLTFVNGNVVIDNTNSFLLIRRCIFKQNNASMGSAISSFLGTNIIEESSFLNNTASSLGGAIFARMSTFQFSDTNFEDNKVYGNDILTGGGALAFRDCQVNGMNLTFNNNQVINTLQYRSFGGAIYSFYTQMNLNGSHFNNNYASGDLGCGGGIASVSQSVLTLNWTDLTDNEADLNGGAIYSLLSAEVSISNSLIQDSKADTYGGAIYLEQVDSTIVQSTMFQNNQALKGGGIYSDAPNNRISIMGSTFEKNVANDSGGALYFTGPDFIELAASNTDNDNTAQYGPYRATPVTSMKVTNNLAGQITQTSGVPMGKPYYELGLYDRYDQLAVTELQSSASIVADTSGSSFKGGISAVPVNGLITFDSLVPNWLPNTSAGFHFQIFLNGQNFITSPLTLQVRECIAGEYVNTEFLVCSACPPGTYSNMNSSVNCTQCSPGKYQPNSSAIACSDCPMGQATTAYGTVTCNACADNEFTKNTGSVKCITCPSSGVECNNGQLKTKANFWLAPASIANTTSSASTSAALQLFPCPPNRCAQDRQCTINRLPYDQNPLCGQCLPGYSEWGGSCLNCSGPSGGYVFGYVVVTWCAAIFLIWIASSSEESTNGGTSILIYYVQTAVFMLNSTSRWSDALSVLNFHVSDASGGKLCLGPLTPYERISLDFFTPLLVGLEITVTVILHRIYSCCKKQPSELSYIRAILSLYLFSYTGIAELCINMFNCTNVGDQRVLFSTPSVNCSDSRYGALLALSIILLIFHVVGTPVALFFFLQRAQKNNKFETEEFRDRYGLLYAMYQPNRFYMELYYLGRRVLLVTLSVAFFSNASDRYAAFSIVAAIFLLLQALTQPYLTLDQNIIAIVSLFFLVMESILLTAYIPLPTRVQWITLVIFIIPSFCLAIYVGWVMVSKVKKHANERYEQARLSKAPEGMVTPTGTNRNSLEDVALTPLSGDIVVDEHDNHQSADHQNGLPSNQNGAEIPQNGRDSQVQSQSQLSTPQQDVRPVSSSTYQGAQSVSD